MLLSYSIPRALRSLSTNWRASLNSALIIAASLSVLGMGVLLYLNVMHFSRIWLSNTTISLFLRPEVSAAQRRALLERVRDDPLVVKAEVVSPQKGMAMLGAKLGSDHGLLEGVDVSHLPYTIDFEVDVEERDRIHGVVAKFTAMDGVEEVVYAERALDNVKLFFTVTRGIGLFFVVLILLSYFMIVSNAIRLSLHTRREEIEILSAVGATHGVIRSSFVIEGILLSMAGFLIALAIVGFGYQLIVAALTWNEATMVLKERAIFFSREMLIAALAISVVVGGLGSRVSVNRLLRGIEG